MGSSSKVVRPEEVLESLKNDGSIDALRMKIIAQLKANVRAGFPSSPDSPPIHLSLFLLLLLTITIVLEIVCCRHQKRNCLLYDESALFKKSLPAYVGGPA